MLLSGLAIGAALSASVSDASPSAGTRGHLRSSARLSDKDHHQHEDRGAEPADYDYDHEAFLGGAEEAHEFDNLDPEESKVGAAPRRAICAAPGSNLKRFRMLLLCCERKGCVLFVLRQRVF